jgi:arsenate reductase-like glutaredoxin family protein
MSDVIAVRVTKKLKDELQELNLDYAPEVRDCLERMVKKRKLKELMRQIDSSRNELYNKTGVTTPSADIIREDREHAH